MRFPTLPSCSSLATVALLGAAACGDDSDDDPGTQTEALTTWHQDIAPLVAEHCVGCHGPAASRPSRSMTTRPRRRCPASCSSRSRPGRCRPGTPSSTDDCAPRHEWRDDPRLSPADVELLRAWVADGAPAGDAATAAPLPERPAEHLANATHQLTPASGFVTAGDKDQFVCFLMDPEDHDALAGCRASSSPRAT